jgi:hypothetical protein
VALAFDPPLASYASQMQVRFLDRTPEFVSTKFVSDGFFNAMGTPLLAGRDFRQADPPLVLDYLALVDPATFTPVADDHRGEAILAVAARVGGTRLIDNVVLTLVP